MITKHVYFSSRPSSRVRAFRVLESLVKSDSFLGCKFIIAGATHVGEGVFLKKCEEYDVHIHLQRRLTVSWLMRILPIPKPIDFVVTLSAQQLVKFIQSIDQFLIAKVLVVREVDFKGIIDALINSDSPVDEKELTFSSDFFVYGFDFDVQDPHNPVEEIYSYSSVPSDLKLFFD